jgi:DNA-binding beta-propeller fold protein YncE
MFASYDSARAVAVSSDGSRVFITGGEGFYLTIAYDADTGARVWARHSEGGSGTSLGVSPDGSTVFVTGLSAVDETDADYLTIAYDADTGAKAWARPYVGPAAGDDSATSLGVSPDSSTVFVTGESAGTGTGTDYATIAYDAETGAKAWAARYDGPASGDDHAASLAVDPDGTDVFVSGGSESGATDADYATVTYRAATGEEGWARRYDGPAGADDAASSSAVSPDGTLVLVTGGSERDGSRSDFATLAYRASTGAIVWLRRYDGPSSRLDYGASLAVSPDGLRVYVAGTSFGSGTTSDFATISYKTRTGVKVWVERYDGPATSGSTDNPHDVAVSPDGSKVVVTGESQGLGTGQDYATVAYAV